MAFLAGAGNGEAAIWVAQLKQDHAAGSTDTLWQPLQWHLAADLSAQPLGQVKKGPAAATAAKRPKVGTVEAIGVERPQILPDAGVDTLVAVGTSTGTIFIWSIPSDLTQDKPKLAQTLSSDKSELGTALPLDIAIVRLPGTHSWLMATACTDRKLVLWTSETAAPRFTKAVTLAGHDDWVRSLDFSAQFAVDDVQLSLASASQDGSVRLWRIRRHNASLEDRGTTQAANQQRDAFEALAKQVEDDADENAMSNKLHVFTVADALPWAVSFDALLTGHESAVTGVRWAPHTAKEQPAALLSASTDNSVILWTPSTMSSVPSSTEGRLIFPSMASQEAASSMWLPAQRFGELGQAGAGALGMFGSLWSPSWHRNDAKQMVLGNAWAGAIHLWARDGRQTQMWDSAPSVTAHCLASKSGRWASHGQWFMTTSLDRTARLFAKYRSKADSWHEIARAQTHGYDLECAAWLDDLSFVSTADEKVARVFAAPQSFIDSAEALVGGKLAPRKRHNLLAINLPTADHLQNPGHLEGPVQEATRQTCHSMRVDGKLSIFLCSPLFDDICRDPQGSLQISFEEIESLLRWCYAQAWGVAVQQGAFLIDVDVCLIGEGASMRAVRDGAAETQQFWAIEDAAASLPFLLAEQPDSSSAPSPDFLPLGRPFEAPATSTRTPASSSTFPRHRVVALGGTFDHLHVGHKILLSMASLVAIERLIVGVTDDSMLSKKSNPHLLETTGERIAAVDDFVQMFRSNMQQPGLQRSVVELQDVCGPAGSEADLQAMILTDETVSGGDTIDKTRQERGLATLERHVIGVVGAGGETDVKGESAAELAAAKVGSTAIREWLSKQSTRVQTAARRKTRMRLRQYNSTVRASSSQQRPAAASVPALGLSNRAVFEGQAQEAQVDELGRSLVSTLPDHLPASGKGGSDARPPVEEELLGSTLWPEVDKLYGHGYELLCCDASPLDGGRLVATSCRAASTEHCVVRIYDQSQAWKQIGTLEGHTLSVTRIRFSPDGRWILTVSRDRTWRLFSVRESRGSFTFEPFAHADDAAHSRIIWDASWTDDGKIFATASRDRSVKIWRIVAAKKAEVGDGKMAVQLVAQLPRLTDAATALAFDAANRLAVGLDNGTVVLYQLQCDGESGAHELQHLLELTGNHSATVNELAWQPQVSEAGDDESALLLSVGEDGAVRLTRVE